MDKGNIDTFINSNNNPNLSLNGISNSKSILRLNGNNRSTSASEENLNSNDNMYKSRKSITPEIRSDIEKEKIKLNKDSNQINENNNIQSNNINGFIYDADMIMKNEIYNQMIMELERYFNKELCKNQLEIIYIYSNKGKFQSEMFPGILNSVHPTKRFEVFKLVLENLYEWPNDETYFNNIICFLPANNHSEAKEIIKDKNRAACCCNIF
jgi:hypothetical protein